MSWAAQLAAVHGFDARSVICDDSADSSRSGANSINGTNDIALNTELDAFADATDAAEHAAIQVEDRPLKRLRGRLASWAMPDDEPMLGDYCACCAGALWWIEAGAPRVWRRA